MVGYTLSYTQRKKKKYNLPDYQVIERPIKSTLLMTLKKKLKIQVSAYISKQWIHMNTLSPDNLSNKVVGL